MKLNRNTFHQITLDMSDSRMIANTQAIHYRQCRRHLHLYKDEQLL